MSNTVSPYRRHYGYITPTSLAESSQFTLAEKAVYGRLTMYAGRGSVAYPSIPTLAKSLDLSERHVKRCIVRLEQKGLIACQRKRGCANRYSFLENETVDASKRKPSKVVTFCPSAYKEEPEVDSESIKTDIDPQPAVAVDPLVAEVQHKTSELLQRPVTVESAVAVVAAGRRDAGLIRAVLWRLSRRHKPIRSISYIITTLGNHFNDSDERDKRSHPERSMPVARMLPVADVPDFLECAA